MADTTTELEVLDEIVDVLGGQSGQHETVVPVLEDIRDLLGGGNGGYNPSLSVGRADALTGADSTAQWATRESTGTGSATVRSVQGAAVVWNQLNQNNRNTATINGVTFTNNNDGTWTVSGTATSDTSKEVSTVPRENGHTYLVRGCPSGGSVSTYFVSVAGGVHDVGNGYIYTSPTYTSTALYIVVKSGTTVDNLIFTPQLFNLTQMFGSGNEPQTVAEFEQMYPAAYYPYSAPTLKPIRIAGIRSTDAQGGELDSVEWEAFTLRGAGSVADMLYADHVDVNVGVVDLGTLKWNSYSAGSPVVNYPNVRYALLPSSATGFTSATLAQAANVNVVLQNETATLLAYQQTSILLDYQRIYISSTDLTGKTAAQVKEYMAGIVIYYALPTPTTTPISPALPMTYKVQAGGSESIIVPDGEVSATPVLTMAEGESAADVVMDALACIATPDGPVATANHSVGTYLTMQGKLYKVTSAIAVGETITPNTNVSETTVMAELIARTA